jgi:hypothetical protein
MGMKISVGLQKKVGQPNYGSLGASCHVEFEIDAAMIESNLDGFHNKINGAYLACRQAVNAQLRQQEVGQSQAPLAENRKQSQNGSSRTETDRGGAVTPNQLKAIYAIAKRLRLNPELLVNERFDCHVPEDLTFREASQLIDELRQENQQGSTG